VRDRQAIERAHVARVGCQSALVAGACRPVVPASERLVGLGQLSGARAGDRETEQRPGSSQAGRGHPWKVIPTPSSITLCFTDCGTVSPPPVTWPSATKKKFPTRVGQTVA